jgi:hypothetical protein
MNTGMASQNPTRLPLPVNLIRFVSSVKQDVAAFNGLIGTARHRGPRYCAAFDAFARGDRRFLRRIASKTLMRMAIATPNGLSTLMRTPS